MSSDPKGKNELIETFAHDLKSPISGIKGFLQMVEQLGDVNDKQAVYVQRIYDGVDRLLKMINDMLDYSRLETATSLQREQVDLAYLIHMALALLESQIASKNIEIKLDISQDLPTVLGDKEMLNHALMNLMSNAVKYNGANGIVAVRAYRDDMFVSIEVQDTGMGIPLDEIEQIFDRFYRAKASKRQRIEGTGLGLSIVKRVAETHGGSISVTSEEGVGSVFRLSLPLVSSNEHTEKESERLRHIERNEITPHLRQMASEALDAVDDDSQESPEEHDTDSKHDQR